MKKFIIESGKPIPRRKYGRNKHNDKTLVEQGVDGIKNGTYKTYGEAALYLRPLKKHESMERIQGNDDAKFLG